MEYAYDPTSGRNLTVDGYKDLYGSKRDKNAQLRKRPTLRCLACNIALHTVAEDSGTSVPVWGHDPAPGTFCPIKTEGAAKYQLLAPKEHDPAAGQALRASFFSNWEAHWGYVRKVVPLADIHTLIGFLKVADKTQFWNQRHLEEWHIPYVFLSTCEFPPPAGPTAKHRPEWLRFRFDSRYRTLEDLWIYAEPSFSFIKLSYRNPARRREPGPADFLVADNVPVDPKWLARTYSTPHAYVVDKMSKEFPLEI